jgi:hypothetical protein
MGQFRTYALQRKGPTLRRPALLLRFDLRPGLALHGALSALLMREHSRHSNGSGNSADARSDRDHLGAPAGQRYPQQVLLQQTY